MFKVLLIATLLMVSTSSSAAEEGQPAPEFEADLVGGGKYKFTPEEHHVVVFHFWASWCKACLIEMPALNDFYLKHRSEGLNVVAINMNEAKDENKVREQMKKYSFPWAFAKEATYKKYGRIWHLPMTFVIDRKGILKKEDWKTDKPLDTKSFEDVVSPLLKTQ